MDAILVFNPSNDLLFVKSSKLFRQRVLKYSKLNDLIATSALSAQTTVTSSSSSPSSSAASPTPSCVQTGDATPSQRPRRQRACRTRHRDDASSGRRGKSSAARLDYDDTSERYLDILMLLLTPYVASLRLSASLGASGEQRNESVANVTGDEPPPPAAGASGCQLGQQVRAPAEDLLSKFMRSININHECQRDMTINATENNLIDPQASSSSTCELKRQPQHQPFVSRQRLAPSDNTFSCEFSARKISTQPMPIDCLKDCQIAYCELQQFIFIYMQELDQVSSFKMRLLQKRIDLFARISLLLFGPSLNSLRRQCKSTSPAAAAASTTTITSAGDHSSSSSFSLAPPHGGERLFASQLRQQVNDQARTLRHVYEVWLEHQYEPELLLEANEKLIVAAPIHQLCHETLRKVSLHLRKSSGLTGHFREAHVHALLYSDTKLIANYSCRNSIPLNQDDLILLLLLLKTYLLAQQGDQSRTATPVGGRRASNCYASNYKASKRTYEIKSRHHQATTRSHSVLSDDAHGNQQCPFDFPSSLLVFLSTSGKRKSRVRVPHMLRFVTLSPGITLVLISEISTSYLAYQIGRLLGLMQELNRINFVAEIKLAQLATVNDCVCAIKSYFYGQSYDLILNQGASDAASPTGEQRRGKWSGIFGRYFGRAASGEEQGAEVGQNDGGSEQDTNTSVYARVLNESERRLCRQLMMKLEELISNNAHTYMRRTFSFKVDERKREALLTSVTATLRESLAAFVMDPQMARLNDPFGEYARHFAELLDECKLIAGQDLSDYLDYLSVKSTCNITLGAPLTHDMPAVKSFIYVDRSRQQMLMSPVRPGAVQMDRRSLLEADFWNAVARGGAKDGPPAASGAVGDRRLESSDESDLQSGAGSSSGDDSDLACDGGSESDGSNVSSAIGTTRAHFLASAPGLKRGRQTASGGARFKRKEDASWLLGASGDILIPSEVATPSSSCSQSTQGTGAYSSAGDLMSMRRRADVLLDEFSGGKAASSMDLAGGEAASMLNSITEKQQHHNQLVDENLMKGFTCFIYNRLANGQTSFSSNDGTYVYSYFLWFKRNSGDVVEISAQRKTEAARRLAANYSSLPSVICDDFFNNYSRCMFADEHQQQQAARTKRGQVEISCQISQVDASRGNKLVRRRLNQLKEEESCEDEDDDADVETATTEDKFNPAKRAEQDNFLMFLRSQTSRGRSRVRVVQGIEAGSSKNVSTAKHKTKPEPRPKCYELFCIHQASLLVHRSQVLVEAERLTRRLDKLISQ